MKEPETPRGIVLDDVAYRDGRYALGSKDGCPYLAADGRAYKLTCHPYEPCLYVTGEDGFTTAVHNAFDPSALLDIFRGGGTTASITGREYDARDFCRMVEYAAGMGNIGIDDAERVFGVEPKKIAEKERRQSEKVEYPETAGADEDRFIINDERFSSLIAGYPDLAVDYCLVENERNATGENAHRTALFRACRKLFTDSDDGEAIWDYDAAEAEAKPITAAELFAPADKDGKLNYRMAFLSPPYGSVYTDADFDKVNAALFPNGTDGLEVYEWTTDWSEYFDDGREWWGTLCLTVCDETLDRFAVIMASATD
ncbi:MAG: hypothetical protein IJL83_04900 [Clostridia bacterium]|nr:hypothetical protein [Clostridia bacterium]